VVVGSLYAVTPKGGGGRAGRHAPARGRRETGNKRKMEKPQTKIVDEDGNVFSIIGMVCETLREVGQIKQSKEFFNRAFVASSYDEILALITEYCEVD